MAGRRLLTSVCLLLLAVQTLRATRCWQFTWPGVVDWSSPNDNDTSCDGRTEPCIEPFVLSMNHTPPNITKLQQLCEDGGCPAELWCNTKPGESCVRWVFWTSDVNTNSRKMKNFTLFCGTGHSGDNATGIYDKTERDGCFRQDMANEMLETCFCYNEDCCNRGGGLGGPSGLVISLLVLVVAGARLWQT